MPLWKFPFGSKLSFFHHIKFYKFQANGKWILLFYFILFFCPECFIAAKTEFVVLTVKIWCRGLWNLLCNPMAWIIIKIFCFPPFLSLCTRRKKKVYATFWPQNNNNKKDPFTSSAPIAAVWKNGSQWFCGLNGSSYQVLQRKTKFGGSVMWRKWK